MVVQQTLLYHIFTMQSFKSYLISFCKNVFQIQEMLAYCSKVSRLHHKSSSNHQGIHHRPSHLGCKFLLDTCTGLMDKHLQETKIKNKQLIRVKSKWTPSHLFYVFATNKLMSNSKMSSSLTSFSRVTGSFLEKSKHFPVQWLIT